MLYCIRTILFIISDESPSTCEMFLGEGGLDLFMQVLEVEDLIVFVLLLFKQK